MTHRRRPPVRPCTRAPRALPPRLDDDQAGWVPIGADALALVAAEEISAVDLGRYGQGLARAAWCCTDDRCGCGRAHVAGTPGQLWQLGRGPAGRLLGRLRSVGLAERRPGSQTSSFRAGSGLTARLPRSLGRDTSLPAHAAAVWVAIDLTVGAQRAAGGAWSHASDETLARTLRVPVGRVRSAVAALAAAGWLQILDTPAGRVLVLRLVVADPFPTAAAEAAAVDKERCRPRPRRRAKGASPQPRTRAKGASPQAKSAPSDSAHPPPAPRETQEGADTTGSGGEEHSTSDDQLSAELRARLGPNDRRELDALCRRRIGPLDWPRVAARIAATGALDWPQADLADALGSCLAGLDTAHDPAAVVLWRWHRLRTARDAATLARWGADPGPDPGTPPAALVDDSEHLAALAAAPPAADRRGSQQRPTSPTPGRPDRRFGPGLPAGIAERLDRRRSARPTKPPPSGSKICASYAYAPDSEPPGPPLVIGRPDPAVSGVARQRPSASPRSQEARSRD